MHIKILDDVDSVAREAARIIAAEARTAVAARGRFIVAFSGGTPQKNAACFGRRRRSLGERACGAGG